MKKLVQAFIVIVLLTGAVAAFWWINGDSTRDSKHVASLEQGIALFEQKQYPEVLAELEPLATGGSENWRVYYYLGSTHMMLKDYAAAATALEQSLSLRPEESGTLYALGVVYYKLGKLSLAKAYFGAVLEINPNDEQAKGLMDIMTKLEQNSAERQSTGDTREDGS